MATRRKAEPRRVLPDKPDENGVNPPEWYRATRDLIINGVAAHRAGDLVHVDNVRRWGWENDVEAVEE